MQNTKLLSFGLGISTFLPAVAFAQQPSVYFTNVYDFFLDFGFLVDSLIGVVTTLALLFFLWGLAKFILAAGDESKIAEGKRIMFWGVIALFVMVSVWGIVAFLQDLFGV